MSVPLSHYLGHDRCKGLRLTCLTCWKHEDIALDVVIARLEARGVGGAQTGVKEVAKHVRSPCSRCGGTSFDTSPAW